MKLRNLTHTAGCKKEESAVMVRQSGYGQGMEAIGQSIWKCGRQLKAAERKETGAGETEENTAEEGKARLPSDTLGYRCRCCCGSCSPAAFSSCPSSAYPKSL